MVYFVYCDKMSTVEQLYLMLAILVVLEKNQICP